MMQTELNFDRPHNGTSTSIAAADSQSPVKATIDRERILAFVLSNHGATREEIETATGLSGNTVRPRVWELVRSGRLVETAEQRNTRSGRKASVLGVAK